MTDNKQNSRGSGATGVLVPLVVFAGLVGVFFWNPFGVAKNTFPVPSMVQTELLNANNKPVYVQKYEVSVKQWNLCHDDGACSLRLKRKNNDTDVSIPATGLNWFDVQEYLAWINAKSGKDFRLPTSKEWSMLAKEVLPEKPDPIFTDPDLTWASAYLMTPKISRKLRPSGSFKQTSSGIFDLNGNVWEWTSDCYAGSLTNVETSKCPAFYVGGEHVAAIPIFSRKPARGGCAVGSPPAYLGLRLLSDDPVTAT